MTEKTVSLRKQLFDGAVEACILRVKNILNSHVVEKCLSTTKKLPYDLFNEYVLDWCAKQNLNVCRKGDEYVLSWGHVTDVSNDELFAVFLAKKTLENFKDVISTKSNSGAFAHLFAKMTITPCVEAWVKRNDLTLTNYPNDSFYISWDNK